MKSEQHVVKWFKKRGVENVGRVWIDPEPKDYLRMSYCEAILNDYARVCPSHPLSRYLEYFSRIMNNSNSLNLIYLLFSFCCRVSRSVLFLGSGARGRVHVTFLTYIWNVVLKSNHLPERILSSNVMFHDRPVNIGSVLFSV